MHPGNMQAESLAAAAAAAAAAAVAVAVVAVGGEVMEAAVIVGSCWDWCPSL